MVLVDRGVSKCWVVAYACKLGEKNSGVEKNWIYSLNLGVSFPSGYNVIVHLEKVT